MKKAGPSGVRTVLLAGALALALVCSACGTNDDSDTADVRSGAPEAVGTDADPEDPTTDDTANDQGIAEAALLTIGDLPAGWETQAPSRASQEPVADCERGFLNLDNQGQNPGTGYAESEEFMSPDDESLGNVVSLFADEGTVIEGFEMLRSTEWQRCLEEGYRVVLENDPSLGSDVEVGEVTVGEISLGDYGDDTVALRVTVPVTAPFPVTVYLDLAFVRLDRAMTMVEFSAGGWSPPDPTQLSHYTEITVDRLGTTLETPPGAVPDSAEGSSDRSGAAPHEPGSPEGSGDRSGAGPPGPGAPRGSDTQVGVAPADPAPEAPPSDDPAPDEGHLSGDGENGTGEYDRLVEGETPTGIPSLDPLARACETGDMVACDDLLAATWDYADHPNYSDYWAYAGTCAGRGPAGNASCVDQFGPTAG